MKRVLNFGGMFLMLTVLFGSCGKDPKMEQSVWEEGTGRFALQLGTMGSFEVITARAADEEVEVGEFTVRVKGTTLKQTAYDSTWLRYADMPSVVTIPAGDYTISAYNGEQKSGFKTPYYYGEKNFSVGIQELTDAQVVCQLACVKLSVEFTSLFLSNVNDPVCIIHQNEGVSLQFDPTNNAIGYIAAPADSTLAVTVRGTYAEDGSEVNRTYFIEQVGARQWHKISLSVNTSAGITNGGGMIRVDHSVDEKNTTVLIPGSDDLIDNNGDTGSWDDEDNAGDETPGDGGETPTTPLSIIGKSFNGNAFDVDEPIVVIGTTDQLKANPVTLNIELQATNGIQKLYLQMESTETMTQSVFGGMGKMDLANPAGDANAEMVTGIVGMTENPVKGQKSYLFSIGAFMELLPAPEASEGKEYHEHTFYITLEDGAGNSLSKTLIIRRKEA